MTNNRQIFKGLSRNTADQAEFLRERLGQAPFYLVTFAGHMPKVMRLFIRSGTKPIAAPTDFRAVWTPFQVGALFPHAGTLADTESAFYEYLGLCWAWVK